ncbi:MAG: PEP-CTERM sorting domain-containing protein [Verrucomicrobiaceae bacterium]|nr:PEP-CTERM sorting domain-containing protein [Verrucomicrobiaceae bacterium]
MKHLICSFIRPLLFAWALTSSTHAAIIYSGLQNVAIPFNADGVYVNVVTNATSTSEPGNFATAPWINPFWGGTKIASTDILRPSVISGTAFEEQVLNRAYGDLLLPTDYFAADYNGSETHIGPALNQFQIAMPGYIGFSFELAGDNYYGWARMTAASGSAGTLHDWAYNNVANEGIVIGQLVVAVPEPSRTVLLLSGLLGVLFRRRRSHKSP